MLETTPKPPEVEEAPEPPASDPVTPAPPAGLACAACGAPLEPDQECCVECGEVVHRRRLLPTGWPLRTGLASGTALVLSGFVGLAASVAFQGGGNVPRKVASHMPAHPLTAPAVPPTSSTPPATPLKPAPGAATPPAAHPTPSTPAAPPSTAGGRSGGSPAAVSPHRSAGTPHSAGPSGNSGGGSPGPQQTTPAQPATGPPDPFPNGTPPYGAGVLNPNHESGAQGDPTFVYDGDTSTAWSTTSADMGLWLDAGYNHAYPMLGIWTSTPGVTVTIYGSSSGRPPSSVPSNELGSATLSKGKNRIPLHLNGTQPRYYVIWITGTGGGKASIAEASLLGG